MSDRIGSFLVVLEEAVSEEDARQVAAALRLFRGVVGVQPNPDEWVETLAEIRAHARWRDDLRRFLRDRDPMS